MSMKTQIFQILTRQKGINYEKIFEEIRLSKNYLSIDQYQKGQNHKYDDLAVAVTICRQGHDNHFSLVKKHNFLCLKIFKYFCINFRPLKLNFK